MQVDDTSLNLTLRMSNLLLAMLGKLGVRQDSFGDSTGMLTI
jgi:hypothetical protein